MTPTPSPTPTPTPTPSPTPLPGDGCTRSLSGNGSVAGEWTSDCDSEHRDGRYARYYTFSLAAETEVTIDLVSETDAFLFLLRGIAKTGNVLHRNDDYQAYNSRISETLSAGDYTIEATTYSRQASGTFTLTAEGIGSATVPTSTPPATATPTPLATATSTPPATATPGSNLTLPALHLTDSGGSSPSAPSV